MEIKEKEIQWDDMCNVEKSKANLVKAIENWNFELPMYLDNEFNQGLLRGIVSTIFKNYPLLGYKYQNYSSAQTGEILEDVIKQQLNIGRCFLNYVLDDDNYAKLARIAWVFLTLDINSRKDIIDRYATLFNFGRYFSDGRTAYLFMQENDILKKAIGYYRLFPKTLGQRFIIINVPKDIDLEKNELLFIPHTPNNFGYYVYPKGTKNFDIEHVPLIIKPEWCCMYE